MEGEPRSRDDCRDHGDGGEHLHPSSRSPATSARPASLWALQQLPGGFLFWLMKLLSLVFAHL